MLEAAKAEEWDDVVRCEGACAILIEQLRLRAKSETLDQAARDEKNRIMLNILRNDALIRNLVEPVLEDVELGLNRPQYLH
jgi:flagellar protein FliT